MTPELVDARPGQAARTRWGQQFDASLTDVFQVQADIATKVADALGVALADSARRELTAKPTENLAAYDEFLKGEAAAQGMSVTDPPSLRRAIGFYERAVALDSTFVQAWAQLSRARSSLYSNGVPGPGAGRAGAARGRARPPAQARRSAGLPRLRRLLRRASIRSTTTRPWRSTSRASGSRPTTWTCSAQLASTETSLGRWDGAAARLAARVAARSALGEHRRAGWPTCTRSSFGTIPPPTPPPTAPSRSRRPTRRWCRLKVLVALARGDLDSARAVIRAAPAQIDPATLLPFLRSTRISTGCWTTTQQRQVLALPPSAFDDDRATWGIVRAELYHLRGDRARAGHLRRLGAARVRGAEPGGAGGRAAPRAARAGAGLSGAEGRRGARGPARRGADADQPGRATSAPTIQLQLVRIYLLIGEPEKALDQLEPLLRVPFYLSPGWLRIDPTFDPLRSNPRFKRLVEGTA